MRIYLMFFLIISFSCKNNSTQKKPADFDVNTNGVSSQRLRVYDSLRNNVDDSIAKYKLHSFSDSLIKYIYITTYSKRIENYNLTTGEVDIIPIRFIRMSGDTAVLYYSYVISEKNPIVIDFVEGEGSPIIGFDFNISDSGKIYRAKYSETAYMEYKGLKNLYYDVLQSKNLQEYLHNDDIKISKTFRRVMGR